MGCKRLQYFKSLFFQAIVGQRIAARRKSALNLGLYIKVYLWGSVCLIIPVNMVWPGRKYFRTEAF